MASSVEASFWELYEQAVWVWPVPPELDAQMRVLGGTAIRLDRQRYMRVRNKARYHVDPVRHAQRKRYSDEHAEAARAYAKEWYQRNEDRVKAAAKEWRDRNRAIVQERQQAWRRTERGRACRREQKRRARERGAEWATASRKPTPYIGQYAEQDKARQRAKARSKVQERAVEVLKAMPESATLEAMAALIAENFDLRRNTPDSGQIVARIVAHSTETPDATHESGRPEEIGTAYRIRHPQ